ncbi:1707_t:CDS:2 [Funneliformis caledonium]|uniref:1707_t:CDS:1 n=1 Tax=Funneliformis caledonium TaxID=1117310 RepID=A0A9N9DRW4_9GLOM|nr:1707_t:CDS:2 [Funneliformis caledonium]
MDLDIDIPYFFSSLAGEIEANAQKSELQAQPRQQIKSHNSNPNDIFHKLLEKVNLKPSDFLALTKALNEPYLDQLLSWLLMTAESKLSTHEITFTANVENSQESQVQPNQTFPIAFSQGQESATRTQSEFFPLNSVKSKIRKRDGAIVTEENEKNQDKGTINDKRQKVSSINAGNYKMIADTNGNEITRYSIFEMNNIENNRELEKMIETGWWVLNLGISRISSTQNHSRDGEILQTVILFCVTDRVLARIVKSLNHDASSSHARKLTDESYSNLIKARIGTIYTKYGSNEVFNFIDPIFRDIFEKLLIAVINNEDGANENEILEKTFSGHFTDPEILKINDNTIDSHIQQRCHSIPYTRWRVFGDYSTKVNDASMKAFNAHPEYYCIYQDDSDILVEVYMGSKKFAEVYSKFWKTALYEAFWMTYEKLGLNIYDNDKTKVLSNTYLGLCK